MPRQSETATGLAQWLDKLAETPVGQEWDGVQGGLVDKVWHSSLQAKSASWDIRQQLEGGFNATFSVLVGSHKKCMLIVISNSPYE